MFSVWFLGYSIAYNTVPETSLEDWTVNKVFFQHQNLNIIGYYPLRKVAGIVCEAPLLSSASPATSSSFPPDITQFVVNRLGRSNVYIWLFLNTTTWCCWPPLLFLLLLLLLLLLFLHATVFFLNEFLLLASGALQVSMMVVVHPLVIRSPKIL